MPRCFLGLGGNVGDVARTFAAALDALSNEEEGALRVVRTSSIYRTAPVGDDAGGEFLNAAAQVETDLPPRPLLKRMQQVETAFGRTRGVHWGPRPLDLDLLLYGDEIIDDPALTVPHPALWYRRFVLDPLVEIAADVAHPVEWDASYQRGNIWQLRQRLLIRPFRLRLACNDDARSGHLLAELRRRFEEIEFDAVAAILPSGKVIEETLAVLNRQEPVPERLPTGRSGHSAGLIPVPDDDDGGLEFLTAVIKAATDEPEIVGGPILSSR